MSVGVFSLLATSVTGGGGVREGSDEYDPNKANITVSTLDKGIGMGWLNNAAQEFEAIEDAVLTKFRNTYS